MAEVPVVHILASFRFKGDIAYYGEGTRVLTVKS